MSSLLVINIQKIQDQITKEEAKLKNILTKSGAKYAEDITDPIQSKAYEIQWKQVHDLYDYLGKIEQRIEETLQFIKINY